MKKTIAAVMLGIVLISLASAIYSGDCLEVDLSGMENVDDLVYDVVGNSSNLEGLTISLDGTIASICTTTNYKPDSFTIIFIDNSTNTIIKEVQGSSSCSGGGLITKVIYKNQTKYRNESEDAPDIIEEVETKEKSNQPITVLTISSLIIGAVILMWGIMVIIKRRRARNETRE